MFWAVYKLYIVRNCNCFPFGMRQTRTPATSVTGTKCTQVFTHSRCTLFYGWFVSVYGMCLRRYLLITIIVNIYYSHQWEHWIGMSSIELSSASHFPFWWRILKLISVRLEGQCWTIKILIWFEKMLVLNWGIREARYYLHINMYDF